MARYVLSKAGVTVSTTQDMTTLVTTATGQGSVLRVYEISLSGEKTASGFDRFQVFRPAAVGVTIGANLQVPQPIDPASVAALTGATTTTSHAGSATAVTSWTTPPTQNASSNNLLMPALNAFGGVYRWVAPPDGELIVGGQGAVANLCICRSLSGTDVFSGHFFYEER